MLGGARVPRRGGLARRPLAQGPRLLRLRLFLGTQVAGTRDPLTLSLAENGIAFDRAFALMTAADMAPLGVDARSGFSYPGALVRNGTLFVAVAADKVTIVLARTKLASLLT